MRLTAHNIDIIRKYFLYYEYKKIFNKYILNIAINKKKHPVYRKYSFYTQRCNKIKNYHFYRIYDIIVDIFKKYNLHEKAKELYEEKFISFSITLKDSCLFNKGTTKSLLIETFKDYQSSKCKLKATYFTKPFCQKEMIEEINFEVSKYIKTNLLHSTWIQNN